MIHTRAVMTEDGGSPAALLPPAYDSLYSVAFVAAMVLAFAALGRLARTRHDALTTLVAAVLIVLVPVLGPAAYLYLTRRHDRCSAQSPV